VGGWGSGRRSGLRETTEGYRSIDVRRWQREGNLEPGRTTYWAWQRDGKAVASINLTSGQERVWLKYRHRSGSQPEWQEKRYAVALEWRPCRFGGERAWFHCPGRGCGRRVAILYASDYFLCRHCLKLAYECQREAPHYRLLRRVQNLRT
jgi:hypothetical protein